jgi:SRSO17 transposase
MKTEILFPGIEEYMAPYYGYFHRSESRKLAECYLAGLLMDGERKSVEPMSERINASERGMQRLLTTAKWDEQLVAAQYRRTMLSSTYDPQGVLVIDDKGFSKKGRDSTCVARQYCGASGKTDNCQIGVSMTYVGQDIAWPYVMELFIPESWDQPDDDCVAMRKKTHMPETMHHKSKWRMALDFIDLAQKDLVPHRAVLADEWYGNIPEFRYGLECRGENYILGAYSNTQVFLSEPVFEMPPAKENGRGRSRSRTTIISTNPAPVKLSAIGESISEEDWQKLELRRSSRDKALMAEAISLRVWPAQGWKQGAEHEEVWLMIERRQLNKGGYELRYFFSNMPQHLATIDLARLYHERYWIEHGYQQLKEELGLNHHEGRTWIGWHRHVLLTFLAYGYLTLLRLQQKKLKSMTARNSWLQKKSILASDVFS